MDIRSTPDNIIEHWHRLVDCKQQNLEPRWAAVKPIEASYGWVTFSSLGVVKSLERDKAGEVGERSVVRLEEHGQNIRGDRHRELEIRDRAEEKCREVRLPLLLLLLHYKLYRKKFYRFPPPQTCAFRLKLCFEAFIQAGDGTIQEVAHPVFSDNILDETRPDKTGDLPIQKISTNSDVVEGGQEVMVFTGNEVTRIQNKRSNFYVEFFELDTNEQKGWQSGRAMIAKTELHTLGQILGGLSFKVPVFDRDQPGSKRPAAINTPTENVFFEITKTNKAGKEESKSDPIFFTYRPSRLQHIKRKRPLDHFLNENVTKREKVTEFVSQFNIPQFTFGPTGTTNSEQIVTLNLPIVSSDPSIPAVVETMAHRYQMVPSTIGNPMSPSSIPLDQLVVCSPNPPQATSPGPSYNPQMIPSTIEPTGVIQHFQNFPSTNSYTYANPAQPPHNDVQPPQTFQDAIGQSGVDMEEFIKDLLAPSTDPQTVEAIPPFGIGNNIYFDGYRSQDVVCTDGEVRKVTLKLTVKQASRAPASERSDETAKIKQEDDVIAEVKNPLQDDSAEKDPKTTKEKKNISPSLTQLKS